MDEITFTLNGRTFHLSRREVVESLTDKQPEGIQNHGVVVDGRLFPIKQAFSLSTGVDRLDFTTSFARRQFVKLEFEVRRIG